MIEEHKEHRFPQCLFFQTYSNENLMTRCTATKTLDNASFNWNDSETNVFVEVCLNTSIANP